MHTHTNTTHTHTHKRTTASPSSGASGVVQSEKSSRPASSPDMGLVSSAAPPITLPVKGRPRWLRSKVWFAREGGRPRRDGGRSPVASSILGRVSASRTRISWLLRYSSSPSPSRSSVRRLCDKCQKFSNVSALVQPCRKFSKTFRAPVQTSVPKYIYHRKVTVDNTFEFFFCAWVLYSSSSPICGSTPPILKWYAPSVKRDP